MIIIDHYKGRGSACAPTKKFRPKKPLRPYGFFRAALYHSNQQIIKNRVAFRDAT